MLLEIVAQMDQRLYSMAPTFHRSKLLHMCNCQLAPNPRVASASSAPFLGQSLRFNYSSAFSSAAAAAARRLSHTCALTTCAAAAWQGQPPCQQTRQAASCPSLRAAAFCPLASPLRKPIAASLMARPAAAAETFFFVRCQIVCFVLRDRRVGLMSSGSSRQLFQHFLLCFLYNETYAWAD